MSKNVRSNSHDVYNAKSIGLVDDLIYPGFYLCDDKEKDLKEACDSDYFRYYFKAMIQIMSIRHNLTDRESKTVARYLRNCQGGLC